MRTMALEMKHSINSLRLRAFLRRYLPRETAMSIAVAYDRIIKPVVRVLDLLTK